MQRDRKQTADRLRQQLAFVLEIDRLKSVFRRSYLLSGERFENSAEHSWHVALMASLLAEHANEPVDTARVVMMMLVHDVVEIDAGDTYVYDADGTRDKAAREHAAAARIFGLLPADQGLELRALWEEFEARETPEARFAAGLDRLMPLLHNLATEGRSWREHDIAGEQVLLSNQHMAEGSETLWNYARAQIEEAMQSGYFNA